MAGSPPDLLLNLELLGSAPELGVALAEWTGAGIALSDARAVQLLAAAAPVRLHRLPLPVVTDAGPWRRAGIPALTLLGVGPDGLPMRGLHGGRDRLAALDPAALDRARRTLRAFLAGLDSLPAGPRPGGTGARHGHGGPRAVSYIRMNDGLATRTALLHAGRELFARHGYDGASIRAITARAGANLGAVTYHFGSKERLYEAVLDSFTAPLGARLRAAAAAEQAPLDAIEATIRALYEYLAANPAWPSLMLHELALSRPLPAPVRELLQTVFEQVAARIRAGQRAGSIVRGDARLLTYSIAAQPIYLALVGRRLHEVFGLDAAEAATRRRIVDHAVHFGAAAWRQMGGTHDPVAAGVARRLRAVSCTGWGWALLGARRPCRRCCPDRGAARRRLAACRRGRCRARASSRGAAAAAAEEARGRGRRGPRGPVSTAPHRLGDPV